VATQAACLRMLAAQQFSFDHYCTADACAECDHDDIVKTAGHASMPFSQESHSRIVLDGESQPELPHTPRREIDARGVFILFVRSNHPPGSGVGKPTEAQRHAEALPRFHPELSQQLTHLTREYIENRAKVLCVIEPDLTAVEQARSLNDCDGGVSSAQINRKCWLIHLAAGDI
jgi:hypothetical protein